MADSDDEYDRKRRDKFRGERSSGDGFRAERRDDRRGGGIGGREEWVERNPFRGGGGGGPGMGGGGGPGGGGRGPRPDYRDYRGGPRERYGSPSRDMPPAKRMRPDWGDDMRGNPRGFGGYDPYLMHAWNEHYAHSLHSAYAGHPAHVMPPREPMAPAGDVQTQPAMLTLKQYLDTQDDAISDSEVLRKYTEYKLDFKRQQLNEFFVAHKDEEWFKNKYHPADSVKRKEEQFGFLKKRVDVFNEVLEKEIIKKVTIDTNQTDALIRLLDTVVIKLEGGTEKDLDILNEKPKEVIFERKFDNYEKKSEKDDDVIITSVEKKTEQLVAEPLVVSPRPVHHAPSDEEENWDDNEDEAPEPAIVLPVNLGSPKEDEKKKSKKQKSLKHKRNSSESSGSSSSDLADSSSSSSDDDDEKVKNKYDLAVIKQEDEKSIEVKLRMEDVQELREKLLSLDDDEIIAKSDDITKLQATNTFGEAGTKDSVDSEIVEKIDHDDNSIESAAVKLDDDTTSDLVTQKAEGDELIDHEAAAVESKNNNENNLTETKIAEEDKQPETIDVDAVKEGSKPRALHRTSSIFLRNLAPAITRAEIETVCQRFSGYLRVAIADPLVERRWYRRGWVTFQRDVNIKEICWNLNNTRLRDCEMGAIVNRDLSRRVRPTNGMTSHKSIVRSDIKLCAKIVMNLDEKFKLWDNANRKSNFDETIRAASNGNGAVDAFASVASSASCNKDNFYGFKTNNPVLQNITDFLIEEASAEEEELLGISGELKDTDGETIERDEQLLAVLDKLILYLRIVHSVDYYNHCEYPYEDEMPNRCGIIHARGPPPSKVVANDLQEYIKNFENKMQQFLTKAITIDNEELKNLGCKDADAEVEKFIQSNTQELAKDKWLCPLSGKKFKGPEFIRKHIFNKHIEKVDEVKKEVEFFNNYLRDPKRPQLPEHPGNTKRTNSESGTIGGGGGGGGYRPPMYPPAFAPPYGGFGPPMMMGGGRGGRGFGGGRRELPLDHQRRIIGYHDLDAPANFDMFD